MTTPVLPEWVEADPDSTRMYVLVRKLLNESRASLDEDDRDGLSWELMDLIEHFTHPNLPRLRKETA